jgi:flagellar protein FliL
MAEEEKVEGGAPEAGAEGAEGDAAPAKKKPPILIIALGGVVLLLVVGAVVFFVFGRSGSKEEEHEVVLAEGVGVFMELPPNTLNMLAEQGGENYLKMKLTLELENETDKATVTAVMPRLQDDMNNFLRTLRPEDVQGSAAIQRLKEALLMRANQVLAPVVVKQVLLTEFLVQ